MFIHLHPLALNWIPFDSSDLTWTYVGSLGSTCAQRGPPVPDWAHLY
jgi:hypothetical protein